MTVFWKTAVALIAVALFGWYLSGLGMEKVWESITRIGPYAPLIFIPHFFVYLLDCLGWKRTLPPVHLSFWSLFRIRWAGESLNQLVPSAYVGGEALKIMMLRDKGVPVMGTTTSAVISKTAQTLGQMLFIMLGSVLLFLIVPDRSIRAGVAVVVIGGTAFIILLFCAQKFGLFRIATGILHYLPGSAHLLEHRKPKLLEIDRLILSFYREQPRRFYQAAALNLCGWLVGTVEVYLAAQLLGRPVSWTQALVIEAFAGMAKILGMWIPGSLGVQESGIIIICRLVGLPETLSAAYALIRRGRELLYAAIGLLFLFGRSEAARHAAAQPVKT